MEGESGDYWQAWEEYIRDHLLVNGLISAEDLYLYYRAPNVQSAVDHIQQFYRRYHSSRYVKDTLVIRLLTPLTPDQIAQLNDQFKVLCKRGGIEAVDPLPDENDHLDLPRLAFEHTHKDFGLLRALIDQINAF